jgi:hypothetical protein
MKIVVAIKPVAGRVGDLLQVAPEPIQAIRKSKSAA